MNNVELTTSVQFKHICTQVKNFFESELKEEKNTKRIISKNYSGSRYLNLLLSLKSDLIPAISLEKWCLYSQDLFVNLLSFLNKSVVEDDPSKKYFNDILADANQQKAIDFSAISHELTIYQKANRLPTGTQRLLLKTLNV